MAFDFKNPVFREDAMKDTYTADSFPVQLSGTGLPPADRPASHHLSWGALMKENLSETVPSAAAGDVYLGLGGGKKTVFLC